MGQNGRLLVRLQLGHKSERLPGNHPLGHTHRWTVFVRTQDGVDFRDRSFVEKVRFELHPDFPNHKRTVKDPPFEVSETGYAGFSIPVAIWLAGKQYRVIYDMNLSMEATASSTTTMTIAVADYAPEFYSIAKRFGAEKQRSKEKELLGIPGLDFPASSSSSISPPPIKIRKKERSDDVSMRGISPPPEKIRKKDRSADVSARSSPVPPIERLKIRLGTGEKDSKRGESSISPPIKEKKREERPPTPGDTKEKKKKTENKLLDFVLDRSRPSPSPSPALEKLKKEEKRKDVLGSASPSTSKSLDLERLRKEERKREKEKEKATSSFSVKEDKEKEKKKEKEKNGLTPSPPEKEKRKEKEADRLLGISPPERKEQKERKEKDADRLQGISPPEKQKERKEKREKDGDRPSSSAPSEKKKSEKERDREKDKEKEKQKEKMKDPLSLAADSSASKREKEKKRDKHKERDRSRDRRLPVPSDREKEKEKEKERDRERRKERGGSTITPPPVLLPQECAPSGAGSSSHGRSTSPPTLVPMGNGRSSSLGFGGAERSTVPSYQTMPAAIPSLLSTTIPPPPGAAIGHDLQQPSPSGSIGGRETPSERVGRRSISPGLRNEETASSGGSSASSHSSERRAQKRIPKLAPSQREREAFSAPLPSVDRASLRMRIDSLTDPDKVFEIACLIQDLDPSSEIIEKHDGPHLEYDLGLLEQKELLRLDSALSGS